MSQHVSLVVVALFLASVPLVQRQEAPTKVPVDKVLSSDQAEGRFLGFCEGDYRHVGFQPRNGGALWLFLWERSPSDIDYFLSTQRGEWMRIRHEVTQVFVPEAGGHGVIQVLVDAVAKRESYRQWHSREGTLSAEAREQFEKQVRSQFVDCSRKSASTTLELFYTEEQARRHERAGLRDVSPTSTSSP